MRSVAGFVAFLACACSVQAATLIRMQSLPGDPAGGGAQRIEHVQDTNLIYAYTVTPNAAGGVDVLRARPCNPVCASNPDVTELRFAPAAGQAFGVGTYPNARRYSSPPAAQPGLLADESGRVVDVCPTITGSFVVRELERAADGRVTRFAADFEQHCNGQAPGLYGAVRFNSDVPYTEAVPYAPAALRFTGNIFGGPQTGSFVVLDGRTSTSPPAPGTVFVRLTSPDERENWTVALTSGTSQPVRVGQYSNARAPGSPPGFPTLSVARNGKSCELGYDFASFTVLEIEWSPQNQLVRLAADITIRCEPGFFEMQMIEFRGGLRYNSKVPYISPPNGTTATGNLPNGEMSVSFTSRVPTCGFTEVSFPDLAATSPPTPAPARVAFPYGPIEFRVDNCGVGEQIPVDVTVPDVLPPTAEWWIYGITKDNRTPHWFAIPSAVSGKHISFTVTDGDAGDVESYADGSVKSLGMLVIPGGVQQDLWWSGLAENGWGLSIIQHDDTLFANLFVYDGAGAATWYVMPGGSWDAAHSAYTGAVYLPQGSPYYAYDVSRFHGSSVGSMKLTFTDMNHAALEYSISGVAASKNLTRLAFGPVTPPLDVPLGDLWWGGLSQNGWGIAVLQQYSSLFTIWYTYDAAGKSTWFAMPAGEWIAKGDYRGRIYRPVGPPWLGVPYDASRHHMTDAGTFRYRFSADGTSATFDYTLDGHTGTLPLVRTPF